MGRNAIILIRTDQPVTDDQVLNWSYLLASAFNARRFIFCHDQETSRRFHCIAPVAEYDANPGLMRPDEGQSLLVVHLTERYYAPGYERGDAPLIIAIAYWLEQNIPGSAIFYGAEQNAPPKPFGREQRQKLMDYFCQHGHWPLWKPSSSDIICDFCQKKMLKVGVTVECPGCGHRASAR